MYKGWDGNWQFGLDGGQYILTFYMLFVFLDYTNMPNSLTLGWTLQVMNWLVS